MKPPIGMIDSRLGDTILPEAPISAGSMPVASVTPAVKAAAEQARQKLIAAALGDRRSPVYGSKPDDVKFEEGAISLKSAPSKSERYAAFLERNGNRSIEATARTVPQLNPKAAPCHSFGAVFAEVLVDPDVGMTSVRRVVAVYDVGRIINRRTAQSQFIGGIVWSISLALQEETGIDTRFGRITNANLADYRVPVNADIGQIDVSAIDVPDYKLDSLGARGVGEIGITGTGAAVSNAIFYARANGFATYRSHRTSFSEDCAGLRDCAGKARGILPRCRGRRRESGPVSCFSRGPRRNHHGGRCTSARLVRQNGSPVDS